MSVRLVKIIDPTAIVVGGLVPKGAYNNSTAYSVGDSVSYNGSSYVCITASTGNLPTDTAYWQLVASKGNTGATGPQGPAGTTDYNGLDNLPTLGTAAAKDIPATGNASATEVVYGTDTRLTDSRPASDVSAWAKAPTKPTYTKSEVGLSNADDTSDANKPISTATQTALDTKATTTALDAHANNTSNPHSVTKAQVGLGNVDNTSDANKPVSTAQQTALNAKANASDTANLTGDQTVAGVKTFSSSPIVPTATTTTQAVNKAQMDALTVPKSIVDAKGDLLVGTANDTIARKAVGANGALLMADSNDSSGVVWQSPNPLLVNLLSNSDFSNGTTGWNADASTNSATGGVLSNTADGSAAYGRINQLVTGYNPTGGSRFYFRTKVRTTSAGALSFSGFFRNGTGSPLDNPLTSIPSPAQNVWYNYSGVITASSGYTLGMRMYLVQYWADAATANGKVMEVDDFVLIDLTACFGAGKEPSQSEMDALMSRWTNSWFAKETPQLLPSYDWLKLTQNAATNLVTNGDFSNGTTGWIGTNSSLAAASNTLTVTGSGATFQSSVYCQSGQIRTGQKYYVAGLVRATGAAAPNSFGIQGGGSIGVNVVAPVVGTWYLISNANASATDGISANWFFSATYVDTATATGATVEIKWATMLNLTTIFGAGNEPTKSEMDYLLTKYPNSWFNGTINDLVTRYDSRRRIGTGSPEGVVTAPVGTEWTDTLNTNGALVWRKATGTGNTGWQVLGGDTGWRSITTINGWTAGSMQMRRTGNNISIKIDALNASAMTDIRPYTLPAGFQYVTGSVPRGLLHTAAFPAVAYRYFIDGSINISGAVTSMPVIYGQVDFSTTQAWPTSLPGVSV